MHDSCIAVTYHATSLRFSFQTLQPYTVVIKTPKSPIALREQTTRALRFKVTNTGNAAIQGAAFTVAAPDALTLVSVKTVPPTWNAKHNKTVKAHEQTWTWPLDVQAKKSRTYTLRVKVCACVLSGCDRNDALIVSGPPP